MPPDDTATLARASLEELDDYWLASTQSPYIVSKRYDWLCFYGYFVKATRNEVRVIWSITTTLSLMHFWFDGFIWSVRKGQI